MQEFVKASIELDRDVIENLGLASPLPVTDESVVLLEDKIGELSRISQEFAYEEDVFDKGAFIRILQIETFLQMARTVMGDLRLHQDLNRMALEGASADFDTITPEQIIGSKSDT